MKMTRKPIIRGYAHAWWRSSAVTSPILTIPWTSRYGAAKVTAEPVSPWVVPEDAAGDDVVGIFGQLMLGQPDHRRSIIVGVTASRSRPPTASRRPSTPLRMTLSRRPGRGGL